MNKDERKCLDIIYDFIESSKKKYKNHDQCLEVIDELENGIKELESRIENE